MPEPTLTEIASRIDAFLRRFENLSTVNKAPAREGGTTRYFQASAWRAGAYVGIRYVSFQCVVYLTKGEAARYLKALDSGYVGKHWTVPADA